MIYRLFLSVMLLATMGRAEQLRPERAAALAAQAEAAGKRVVAGRDGWLFLGAELRHMGLGQFWGDSAAAVTRATRADAADPLPAILDFHEQLQELGVNLLLVPVPAKCSVYPDKLPDAGAVADVAVESEHAEFYDLLRERGVRVLDLSALFKEQRCSSDEPLYCLTDSHWSGVACVSAARALAKIIREEAVDRAHLTNAWTTISFQGDLAQMSGEQDIPKEQIRVRRVGTPAAGLPAPVPPAGDGPVILLGDSHNLALHAGGDMHAVGAGLPDQLLWELGRPVELVAVRGSGATPARVNLYRRAARNPDYWQGRRWVVWCFAVREFTESDGWRKVPVKPPAVR